MPGLDGSPWGNPRQRQLEKFTLTCKRGLSALRSWRTYVDLIALGGMAEARTHGKLRMEGKEYIVKDGDILNILFNVSKH